MSWFLFQSQANRDGLLGLLTAAPAKGYPGGSLDSSGPQLATYPSGSRLAVAGPLSGPACCCDVVDLCQAFSQPTGPGRLWISLGAILLPDIQVVDDRTKT